MKIYINFKITNQATGGGNQFLRTFKQFCMEKGCYTENPEEADVILFNSHQYIGETIKLKRKNPSAVFVHRIDGPIRLYNSMSDKRDLITNTANQIIADATVFQSNWSRAQNFDLGLKPTPFETVILNASDKAIFNTKNKVAFSSDRRIRLVSTSWSDNWKKGFDIYQWLDQNLDFSIYEMTFIGNSPVKFNQIRHIQPLSGEELGAELAQHDIFITASQKDPCSNSLIEALHCGLPAVALNDGGHPEIIGKGGELFSRPEEIGGLLEKTVADYDDYQSSIHLPTMNDTGNNYLKFFRSVLKNVQKGDYSVKKLNVLKNSWLKLILLSFRFKSFVRTIGE